MRAKRILSFAKQRETLSLLSRLVDFSDRYSALLQEAGYISFVPWAEFELWRFQESDTTLGPQWLAEVTKSRVASPDGILPQLRRVNKAGWQRRGDAATEMRRAQAQTQFMQLRNEELLKHGNGKVALGSRYLLYFERQLVDAFEQFGFQLDPFRSEAGFPVVSKPLINGWDICWSPETARTLEAAPRKRTDDIRQMSELDLTCYVRAHGARGPVYLPIGFNVLDTMCIRLSLIVSGFGWSYSRFNGIEELELVFSAHSCLYGILGDQVEEILIGALSV